MNSELLESVYIILLISLSMTVLVPVFYWLMTDVREWQRNDI